MVVSRPSLMIFKDKARSSPSIPRERIDRPTSPPKGCGRPRDIQRTSLSVAAAISAAGGRASSSPPMARNSTARQRRRLTRNTADRPC